jgi:hypothetical protein
VKVGTLVLLSYPRGDFPALYQVCSMTSAMRSICEVCETPRGFLENYVDGLPIV